MTEDNVSRVPAAKVALWALLSACPNLEHEAQALKDKADAAACAAADAEGECDGGFVACFEGRLWRCALTQLEGAVERAFAAKKTPLLLDSTGTADVAFLYQSATVVEAKQLVLEVRAPEDTLCDRPREPRASDLAAARWRLRKQLVHGERPREHTREHTCEHTRKLSLLAVATPFLQGH